MRSVLRTVNRCQSAQPQLCTTKQPFLCHIIYLSVSDIAERQKIIFVSFPENAHVKLKMVGSPYNCRIALLLLLSLLLASVQAIDDGLLDPNDEVVTVSIPNEVEEVSVRSTNGHRIVEVPSIEIAEDNTNEMKQEKPTTMGTSMRDIEVITKNLAEEMMEIAGIGEKDAKKLLVAQVNAVSVLNMIHDLQENIQVNLCKQLIFCEYFLLRSNSISHSVYIFSFFLSFLSIHGPYTEGILIQPN